MLNLGTPELLVILLVALIVLGPAKLPEAARKVGQAMNELRRMTSGFEAELRDALEVKADAGPGTKSGTDEPTVTASVDEPSVDEPSVDEPSMGDPSVEQAGTDWGDDSGAVSADRPRTAGDADDHSVN